MERSSASPGRLRVQITRIYRTVVLTVGQTECLYEFIVLFFKLFILITRFAKRSNRVIQLQNRTLTISRNFSLGPNPVERKSVIHKVFNRHRQTFPLSFVDSYLQLFCFPCAIYGFWYETIEKPMIDWNYILYLPKHIDIIRYIIGVGIKTQN